MSKYNAGDLVTIKLDGADAINLNALGTDNGYGRVFWRMSQIVKHEPAPFNWDDVKPGMAFTRGKSNRILLYVGPSSNRLPVFEFKQDCGQYLGLERFDQSELVRAPEHDIEVAK